MKRSFIPLLVLFIVPSVSQAQIGIHIGGGYTMEQGSFIAPCGCTFANGTGGGFSAGLTYDLVSLLGLTVGLEAGVDVKNFSSSHDWNNGSGAAMLPSGVVASVSNLITSDNAKISTTSIAIYPYARFAIPATSIFLQISAGTSLLASSHFSQIRNVVSAVVGNQTVSSGLKYASGAQDTTIENGPVQDLRSLVYSGRLSAGYDFNIIGLTVAPMVTYDVPLSDLRSVNESDWRISSLSGSLLIRFGL